MVCSGFTIVLANAPRHEPLVGGGLVLAGLPAFVLPPGCKFSDRGMPGLDVYAEVGLSHSRGQAEISFGTGGAFNLCIAHGQVYFLLRDDILIGVRVLDLSDEDQRILDDYIFEHP